MNKLKTAFAIGMLNALPILSLAQVTGIQPAPTPVRDIQGIIRILNTIINYFFTFLLIMATIFVFVAAYKYLTAAGNEEQVKSAHNTLIYAAVAIAVAFLAQGVRFIVEQLIRG